MEGFQKFRLLDAAFIIGSILTFIADQATDVILAVTFWLDGLVLYSIVTIILVLVPNAIVQVFSARWNKMDDIFNRPVAIIHGLLMGTLHRYYMVLKLGLEARQTDDPVDYRRYYQQWSDICMLRLFDSFMESAPQLVFQLVVIITKSDWTTFNVTWTGISAIASTVSLGWGVAAYSQALRIVREDKGKMSWLGMVFQTLWRFFMLSARVAALVLLCLALQQWAVIVIFVHWFLMTAWVIWQNTDFCTNRWEERLYNAVVGVIYCFCFFNLKEGRSRYRMAIFYTVMFVENITFVGAYYWSNHHQPSLPVTWFSLGAMGIVLGGTAVGLCSMVLYYRFYHPAGPILPCSKDLDEKQESETSEGGSEEHPGFVIKTATYIEEKEITPEKPIERSNSLKLSRSFKSTMKKPPSPPVRIRAKGGRLPTPVSSPAVDSQVEMANSSNNTNSPASPLPDDCKTSEKMDSAYGTDSNRTASRNTESSATLFAQAGKSPTDSYNVQTHHNISGSSYNPDHSGSSLANRSTSSAAFNNETYMSIENTSHSVQPDPSYMSVSTPQSNRNTSTNSANNTYQSVHPLSESTKSDHNTSQESQSSKVTVIDQSLQTPKRPKRDLLKRSPVVKDVTGFATISSTQNAVQKPGSPQDTTASCDKGKERLHAPLTIIIPNISNQAFTKSNSQSPDKWSDKTISLDILNPENGPPDISSFSSHDYENLALVNINRAPLGPQHWRTYSDMANSRHDDSTKYDRSKLNFTSSSDYSYSNYSNLAYCDIYPLSKAMKEQLYRSLTPVSTSATMATSPDVSDINSDLNSNHTYEPIETASEAFSTAGDYSVNIPVTLIHHDGSRVTANKIVSLDNLRETLSNHEQVPYDDPESRGDLYILAPMRLLTPVIEESESELTRSKIYQTLSNASKSTFGNYSDVDNSIMSIISEVLSVRSTNQGKLPRSVSQVTNQSDPRLATIEEDIVDTNSLLSTIEEIRNNSMCNLYNSSFNDPKSNPKGPNTAPQVPPRNTVGYESLCKENSKSKDRNERQEMENSLQAAQNQRTHISPNEATTMNDSIKSVHSNTLVVTPKTVVPNKKASPLQTTRGCRKNILNLVPSTKDILNTPKRPKTESMSLPQDSSILSESLASENNEFKALMPHLTYTGAKFLNKVKTTPNSDSENDLDGSIIKPPKNQTTQSKSILDPIKEKLSFASPASHSSNLSTMSETPSPISFVRNIGNQKRPKRKLSIVREKIENHHDSDSDYKYGFVKENPDAKYGFGYFPTDSYNLVETAKLCNTSYRSFTSGINPVIEHLQESIDGLAKFNSAPGIPNSYSLSALNKGDTVFKLKPDETYENLQRNNWGTASLQRRELRPSFAERDTATRRSMSILDDYNDEKENIIPRQIKPKSKRPPLGQISSASPMKILGSNPQSRIYQPSHQSSLSPKSNIFRKTSVS